MKRNQECQGCGVIGIVAGKGRTDICPICLLEMLEDVCATIIPRSHTGIMIGESLLLRGGLSGKDMLRRLRDVATMALDKLS